MVMCVGIGSYQNEGDFRIEDRLLNIPCFTASSIIYIISLILKKELKIKRNNF